MSQFDDIAKSYSDFAAVEPVKVFMQQPSALKFLGDVKGKYVLDMGCGSGLLSRQLAQLGAKVIAFDSSSKMIAQAIIEESANPLGIKYFVSSPEKFSYLVKFDFVISVMALWYSSDVNQFQSFFDCAISSLKTNGSFVIIDIDPAKIPFEKAFYNRVFHKLANNKIQIDFSIEGLAPFSSTAGNFSIQQYESCARRSGFRRVVWKDLIVSKEGKEQLGSKYWFYLEEMNPWFGLVLQK